MAFGDRRRPYFRHSFGLARKVQIGDPVIIIAYGSLPLDQAKNFQPKILLLNSDNKIVNLRS
jgi:aspartate 1-decarboxylase